MAHFNCLVKYNAICDVCKNKPEAEQHFLDSHHNFGTDGSELEFDDVVLESEYNSER